MKNSERFSNRVENYVRYRPHYPSLILPFLKERIHLDSGWQIADIGSGTGISSELFLQNGNRVYAIEPNQKMREAAESSFKGNPQFISINATAENSTLPDQSIDLILAGQAFHWFDKTASKKEFQRIAKPNAFLVLMWNERDADSPFQQEYERMLQDFAIDYEKVCQQNIDEDDIRNFFTFAMHAFPNSQSFDFEGLKGRLLSCSYAPLEDHKNYAPMMLRLKQIFDQFQVEAQVEFNYFCKLYYGRFA